MRAHRSVFRSSIVPCALLALAAGCGGGSANSSTTVHHEVEEFDGNAYLYEHAIANVPLLAVREGRVEEAERAVDEARDPGARRGAMRDLAFAHVAAAEGAEEADARRHRQQALRLADRASRSNRDEEQLRDLRFLRVWNAYRSGARNAPELVTAYTTRFQDHSEVTRIAWMIRGELALAREDWSGAREAFRFVMASLDHPFYAYASYRTAQSYASEGNAEESRSRLADVRDRACRRNATEDDVRFGRAAWAELREPAPADPPREGGPAWCPATAGETESVAGTGLDLR